MRDAEFWRLEWGASRLVCFGEERPTLPCRGGVVGSCPTCVTEHRPVAVCHAALQSPTQAKQGWSFLLIVMQCRIMARLAVGMGKRESGGELAGGPSNSLAVTPVSTITSHGRERMETLEVHRRYLLHGGLPPHPTASQRQPRASLAPASATSARVDRPDPMEVIFNSFINLRCSFSLKSYSLRLLAHRPPRLSSSPSFPSTTHALVRTTSPTNTSVPQHLTTSQ